MKIGCFVSILATVFLIATSLANSREAGLLNTQQQSGTSPTFRLSENMKDQEKEAINVVVMAMFFGSHWKNAKELIEWL